MFPMRIFNVAHFIYINDLAPTGSELVTSALVTYALH